jgi:hypothetical protein
MVTLFVVLHARGGESKASPSSLSPTRCPPCFLGSFSGRLAGRGQQRNARWDSASQRFWHVEFRRSCLRLRDEWSSTGWQAVPTLILLEAELEILDEATADQLHGRAQARKTSARFAPALSSLD